MANEVIVMKNVSKEFKVLNRHEGLKGSLKDLFSRDYKIVKAVDNVSLTVERGEIAQERYASYRQMYEEVKGLKDYQLTGNSRIGNRQ